jgi:biopolymer transport protein TolQ
MLTQGLFGQVALQLGIGDPLQSQGTIESIVEHSGPIVQVVLYLLFAFSVISWGIIFYKLYQLHTARRLSKRFADTFEVNKNLATLYALSLKMTASPIAQVFHSGYQELLRLSRNPNLSASSPALLPVENGQVEKVERAMRREIREQVAWLERTLAFLATTASTAPFIGLFGTVCGIVHAFHGLSLAQSASIQAVAPGIAEALVATAVGLFAAIPAVMAFNYFSRQIQQLISDMENFSSDFLNRADLSLS